MTTSDQIERAFSAHAVWRIRLREMCSHQHIEQPLEVIASDNQCEFGRWLYSAAISDSERDSSIYLLVKKNHADFHLAAAEVAELVIKNQCSQAEQMLAPNGRFSRCSAALVDALMQWRAQLS